MPKKQKPKILILYTGGTFGMSPGLTFKKASAKTITQNLLKRVPEIQELAQCKVQVLYQLDSCQMGLGHWIELAQTITESASQFDGVVILHGTDTLAYTAAALSMLLGSSPLPIVLTGAQKPLSTLRNDARGNLISAVELASRAPRPLQSRVMVVFHDEIFLGSRVRKKSARDFEAFESPRFPRLASLGSEIEYYSVIEDLPKLPPALSSSALKQRLNRLRRTLDERGLPQILRMEMTPGFPEVLSQSEFLHELDGVLVTLYASGTAPTDHGAFLNFLNETQRFELPVYAITERENSALRLDAYESGKVLARSGVQWCGNLTPEAAWVKIVLTHLFEQSFERRLSDEI